LGEEATQEEAASEIAARLARIATRGVEIIDPRQTFVAADVDPERLCEGAVLYPGTRLAGRRTLLGPGARVGTEGPATLIDSALGAGASVASGFLDGAVLLAGAFAGANAHFRPGTLLEEEASTAHAVGLKQTVLLSFVTLGSLINFCDCLMAGGTSRSDHSEVGSGFIHFNFTPFGERGDKATPSLIGDVERGVFLRERRIFLGGSAGLVGPAKVGYGSFTVAGQVQRKDVADGRIVADGTRRVDRPFDAMRLDGVQPRAGKNIAYIAQLVALRAWYVQVRTPRARDEAERGLLGAATENIDLCIGDRVKQLARFLEERGEPAFALEAGEGPKCPLALPPASDTTDHVAWVQNLGDAQVDAGSRWLREIAAAVRDGSGYEA